MTPPPSPLVIQAALDKAAALFDDGLDAEAAQLVDGVLAMVPGDERALALKARIARGHPVTLRSVLGLLALLLAIGACAVLLWWWMG